MAFFLIGLLGELCRTFSFGLEYHYQINSFVTAMIAALSHESFLMHSLSVSSFSISLLHLKHNREDASCSFSTGIPKKEDKLAAPFCFFEVSPSNKSRVMHRCITRDHMSFI